jgi:hypothetical protein
MSDMRKVEKKDLNFLGNAGGQKVILSVPLLFSR